MPFSSPTTTSAVKEKRRPPLTTLATRLISTTRSWRSRPPAETERSGAGIRQSLEDEATLAGALGEGLDTAVVLVAAAVEHDGVDARGLGALGQEHAGTAGLVDRLEVTQLGLGPLDRRQRVPAV